MAQITLNSSGVASSGSLLLQTSGTTTQATVDTSGNLGLGVTPSAWSTSFNIRAFQLGGGSFYSYNNDRVFLGQNVAITGGGADVYLSSAAASTYRQYQGAHAWYNAPSGTTGNAISFTQAMTLDASGNLGVGTTSPSGKLHIQRASSGNLIYANDGVAGGLTVSTSGFGCYLDTQSSAGFFAFTKNGGSTEFARIDSSGNLLVGGTSQATGSGTSKISITAGTTNGVGVNCGNGAAGINVNLTSTGGYYGYWSYNGSFLGAITTNGSTITYGGTSDYRLKENIQPMTGALSRVAALKPCTYTWKNSGVSGQGFVAHELAEVCPDAVHGEKDAVNEDGSIKPQMIDTSFLVATLTAALQELNAKFEAYKAAHP